MELCAEPRAFLVAYALVRPVVHVHIQWLPPLAKCLGIHGVPMILAGDKALCGAHAAHRLVMAAVPVFQLVNPCAGSLGQQLIAHADTHAGAHFIPGQETADILHGLAARVGVARPVGQERPSNSSVLKL